MRLPDSPSSGKAARSAVDSPSRPLIRLFDQRDIQFLRSAPGYHRGVETGFRRRRCRVFHAYLLGLRAEFLVARSELETVRAESPKDYRQLALMVLRCRVRFACAMVPAYLSLFRYRWGLDGPRLGPVVQRLDEVRGEMLSFVPKSTDLRD